MSNVRSDIQENSSIRTPRWLKGVIIGVLVYLVIVGSVYLCYNIIKVDLPPFVANPSDPICQPFSTWPINLKLYLLLEIVKLDLMLPALPFFYFWFRLVKGTTFSMDTAMTFIGFILAGWPYAFIGVLLANKRSFSVILGIILMALLVFVYQIDFFALVAIGSLVLIPCYL
ncbi:MAG: hypothetical protein KAT23_03935 [Anaerolineales bacterium]|nr:hypothetical protein [Anaerolineales bacterium]